MRAVFLCVCCLPGSLLAAGNSTTIVDFNGANPMAGWTVSHDPTSEASLTLGAGHDGRGAVLAYQFRCSTGSRCGTVTALWTPERPLSVKRKGALAFWIRAAPEVKLALLLRDTGPTARRYPFEAVTLENPSGGWRQIVIPLAAKSTGYGDQDHYGAAEGRIAALEIVAEPRYPQPIHGTLAFDQLRLLDSPDQSFVLQPTLPLATPPPDSARLSPRLGINIHTLLDDPLLDLVQQAGFSFIRLDLSWSQVERNGRYRFAPYDRLLSGLESRGMGALWILDYGHPQHGGDPPRAPADIDAFARYAAAAVAHFQGRNVRYEIWNEPDIPQFWKPSPHAAEYAALLRPAVAAIRRADPAARVATGGLSRIDLPFLEAVIATGAADGVNAVAVHPYRKSGPEAVVSELPLLRQLLSRTLGEKVEIWDTEWGYASYDYFSQNLRGDGHSPAGRKRQAVLAAREALTVWALGLPVAVWYDLHNDGADPRNPEHNYGLLEDTSAAKNVVKPAMTALRVLIRTAADRNYAGMLPGVPDGAHAMRLDGSIDTVFVLWSEQPDSRITVRFSTAQFISAVNFLGDPIKPRSVGRGESELILSESDGPIYLKALARKADAITRH